MAAEDYMPVQHPSHRRRRVGGVRLLVGFLGAPTAWALQMTVSDFLVSYACYPHEQPLSSPRFPWLHAALIAAYALSVAAGFACAAVAWFSWRRSRRENKDGHDRTLDIGEGRTRFLALISVYASGLFIVAILFCVFTLLLVPPCV
jgi:hypothetical protein